MRLATDSTHLTTEVTINNRNNIGTHKQKHHTINNRNNMQLTETYAINNRKKCS